jgi:hypothetical protein
MMKYELLDGARAKVFANAMRDMYAEVYAEPPYCENEEHVRRFVGHFAEEVDRAGFGLAKATDSGAFVGAAYGWTMAPGRWFSSPTSEPPVEIRDVPKFAIMEWMVRKPYRDSGIGRRLLDLVLSDRFERFAILASNPAAPARQIYERWGWWYCGGSEPTLLPPMDILALPLGHN